MARLSPRTTLDRTKFGEASSAKRFSQLNCQRKFRGCLLVHDNGRRLGCHIVEFREIDGQQE